MKLAALLIATILAAGVLWLAGEEHRQNCERSANTGCSVLPWDNGDPPRGGQPEDMTRSACESYNRALGRAGVPAARHLDCSRSPER